MFPCNYSPKQAPLCSCRPWHVLSQQRGALALIPVCDGACQLEEANATVRAGAGIDTANWAWQLVMPTPGASKLVEAAGLLPRTLTHTAAGRGSVATPATERRQVTPQQARGPAYAAGASDHPICGMAQDSDEDDDQSASPRPFDLAYLPPCQLLMEHMHTISRRFPVRYFYHWQVW